MQKNWRDLIKPKKLEVSKDTLTASYGKFTAEPLERGFGITIGKCVFAAAKNGRSCNCK